MDSNGVAEGSEVVAVRLIFCTLSGCRRGRLVPIEQYEKACTHGVGLAECVVAMAIHTDVMGPPMSIDACGEWRIMPERDSAVVLPWHPKHMCTVARLDSIPGTPSPYCPVNALEQASDYLKEKYGFELKVGFETEFLLLDPKKRLPSNPKLPAPIETSTYANASSIDVAADVLDDIMMGLKAQDIKVELLHGESASGQYELVTGAYPAMIAAHKLLLTRETIAGIARKHGLEATLIPKYFAMQAGSGCHCHFSLMKDGKDATAGSTKTSFTPEADSFTAGILEHMDSVLCFISPSVNSYDRLKPGCWSGAYKIWGNNNKEAPIRLVPRLPSEEGGTTHVEVKSFDATANPHLGLASMIIAGISGLQQGLKLPEPVNGDPGAVAEEMGLQKIPDTLGEAIEGMEKDAKFSELFKSVIGDAMFDEFLAIRKVENSHFSEMPFDQVVEDLYFRY